MCGLLLDFFTTIYLDYMPAIIYYYVQHMWSVYLYPVYMCVRASCACVVYVHAMVRTYTQLLVHTHFYDT